MSEGNKKNKIPYVNLLSPVSQSLEDIFDEEIYKRLPNHDKDKAQIIISDKRLDKDKDQQLIVMDQGLTLPIERNIAYINRHNITSNALKYFIDRFAGKESKSQLDKSLHGYLNNTSLVKISSNFEAGYFQDVILHGLSDKALNPVLIRNYLCHLNGFFTYLSQSNIVDYPIEIEYGTSDDGIILQAIIHAEVFFRDYLEQSLHKENYSDPFPSQLALVLHHAHLLDILYLKKAKKMIFTSMWMKDIKFNKGLMPSFLIHDVESFKERKQSLYRGLPSIIFEKTSTDEREINLTGTIPKTFDMSSVDEYQQNQEQGDSDGQKDIDIKEVGTDGLEEHIKEKERLFYNSKLKKLEDFFNKSMSQKDKHISSMKNHFEMIKGKVAMMRAKEKENQKSLNSLEMSKREKGIVEEVVQNTKESSRDDSSPQKEIKKIDEEMQGVFNDLKETSKDKNKDKKIDKNKIEEEIKARERSFYNIKLERLEDLFHQSLKNREKQVDFMKKHSEEIKNEVGIMRAAKRDEATEIYMKGKALERFESENERLKKDLEKAKKKLATSKKIELPTPVSEDNVQKDSLSVLDRERDNLLSKCKKDDLKIKRYESQIETLQKQLDKVKNRSSIKNTEDKKPYDNIINELQEKLHKQNNTISDQKKKLIRVKSEKTQIQHQLKQVQTELAKFKRKAESDKDKDTPSAA